MQGAMVNRARKLAEEGDDEQAVKLYIKVGVRHTASLASLPLECSGNGWRAKP